MQHFELIPAAAPTDDNDDVWYGREFFASRDVRTKASAKVVVSELLELLTPNLITRAVDVGCGVGTFLRALQDAGVPYVFGIDGPWVDRSLLQIPSERLMTAELTTPLNMGEAFDLALSLEVAEHLPEAAAETFVGSLTCMAPVILFSAAVPQQGGTHHVNEQWPCY